MGELPVGSAPYTFVSVASPIFNQNVPHAITTARLGWCRGFEQLGIPYVIMNTRELAARLPDLPNPICHVQNIDYLYMNAADRAALKHSRHFVWVDYWFQNDIATMRAQGIDYQSLASRTSRAVVSAEPDFIYTISPESSFQYYSKWVERGLKLVSLPLACDTTLYHPNMPHEVAFDNVQLAFVGGYWPYKAIQFDRYLRPYEDQLTIYGRAPWPYAGYGGQLPFSKEAALYRQAKVAPAINEPHCEIFNIDQNERVFKVMGSGGCSITDAIPGYRDWFTTDELAVPTSLADYHEMVHELLTNDALNQQYRQQGYQAIVNRHTYAHRAQSVLDLLGIQAPKPLATL